MSTSTVLDIIIILVLLDIAYTLHQERLTRIRFEENLARVWFRLYGISLRGYSSDGNCACSENGPCMSHYGLYHRWCSGATEADVIGDEISARLKE